MESLSLSKGVNHNEKFYPSAHFVTTTDSLCNYPGRGTKWAHFTVDLYHLEIVFSDSLVISEFWVSFRLDSIVRGGQGKEALRFW